MDKTIVNFMSSLSNKAFISSNSIGRRFDNDIDLRYDFLDPFFLDREKIRLSKSYRRLADKTQVFPPDLHSNVRNRLIHTNDVVNLASLYANILGLNVYLTEAIAHGHDIGHTPFGHLGERLISDLSGKKFTHHVMSVVVAQKIERKGLGLNLSYETLEGILNHSRGAGEMKIKSSISEESNLVMFSDKIAYTFSDLNDALRVGYVTESKLPKIVKYFGKNQRERILKVSHDFIKESSEEGKISFSKSETSRKFADLRSWMYENIYFTIDVEDYRIKIYNDLKNISIFISNYFKGNIDPYLSIACMTDSEVRKFSTQLNEGKIKDLNYGFIEIISSLLNKEINIFDPDLKKENFCF
jgi:dGTPase